MDTVWQDRWQALTTQLAQMSATYHQSSDPVNVSLHALTESLLAFGKDQFNFFWDGFKNKQLLPSMVLPRKHVLRATLDQVAFDMAVIQRISSQRSQAKLQTAQELADKLAQRALNVAIEGKLLPKCSVLTYCNKSANIRIIPYAPIALIGIPFSATKVNRDFLAIPHEVGHYVYHHAPGLAAQLHDCIPLYPDWINHWLEEIFADVYAAFVAGPVCGLSLQGLLLDNSQEKFVADDGEHPPDAVRPCGITEALRHLGDKQAADGLEQLWLDQLATRHYPNEFTPYNSTTAASFDQAKELIAQTAVLFLDCLENEWGLTRTTPPWTSGNKADDTLFDSFDIFCDSLTVDPYYLKVEGENVGVYKPGNSLENARPLGSTQTWRDWIKKESRLQKEVLLPAQAWKPVFTAGYWPIKGPEGNSDGGI
ncbi:MAG: hypothetical protein CL608_27095 [Anaerolineaceae bacterium]|nr:hypothetical protein [Anaerolineaceae bacterium]